MTIRSIADKICGRKLVKNSCQVYITIKHATKASLYTSHLFIGHLFCS